MLLRRYLVYSLGLLFCLGSLNAVPVGQFEDVTLSVSGTTWTVTGIRGSAAGSSCGYIRIYYPNGNQARNIFQCNNFSESENWAGVPAGNYSVFFIAEETVQIGTVIINSDGTITADIPQSAQYYDYSDTIINDTTESQPYLIEILNENGDVIGTRQYWLAPNQMINLELESANPFSVRTKTAGYDNDGFYTTSEVTTQAGITAGDQTGTTQLPVQEAAALWGDGVNDPNLPYDSELNTDGAQIIAALERVAGSEAEQIQNLQNFISYLHGQEMSTVQYVIDQVATRSDDILQAVNSIDFTQIMDGQSDILNAISIINTAANDRDTAIREYILTRTTELDGLGSTLANIQSKADSIKADSTIANNYLTAIDSKIDQINTLQSPVAKAQQINDLRTLFENFLNDNSDSISAADLASLETNIAGLIDQIPALLTDEIDGTELAIKNDISAISAKIDQVLSGQETVTPELNALQTKLDQIQIAIDEGTSTGDALNNLVTELVATTQAMIDTNPKPELAEIATSIANFATGFQNVDFTGSFDQALLASSDLGNDKLDALGAAEAQSANNINNKLDEQTAALVQSLTALGFQMPEPIDYTAKFDELKSVIEAQTLIIDNKPDPIDYTPKFDELLAKPDPEQFDYTGFLGEIRDNTASSLEEAEALGELLSDDRINVLIPDIVVDAKNYALQAKNDTQAQFTSAISVGAVPQATITGGSSSLWPNFTIPVIGTIDLNPWNYFTWLDSAAAWSREILRWAASVAFMFWFWTQLQDKIQNTFLTPVQNTSGGGATGLVATGKQMAISATVLTVVVGLVVALITTAYSEVVSIGDIMAGQVNVTSGAPQMVAFGVSEIAKLIPIGHLLTLTGLRFVVLFAQFPTIAGIQILLRILTV